MTWATSMPILVFLDLSVLDLGPMYATDRQPDASQPDRPIDRQTDRHTYIRRQTASSLNPPPRVGGIIN